MKIQLSIAAIALGVTALTPPAIAEVSWSGPGYYAEVSFAIDYEIDAGPFSNQADCEAWVENNLSKDDQDLASCDYLASEPGKS